MTDPRLSPDDATRWAAQQATKTRCRNCYDNIVQLVPNGRWRDTESEGACCTKNMWHEPMPEIP